MDLTNFVNWVEIDKKQKMYKSSKLITWHEVSRGDSSELYYIPKEKKIGDFKHTFAFNISSIRQSEVPRPLLITLWSVQNNSANQIGLYAQIIPGINYEYDIVLFQRDNGKNYFVYLGEYKLSILLPYFTEISRNNGVCNIKIRDNDGNIILDSGKKGCLNTEYEKIILVKSHGFIKDIESNSSGYISDFNVTEIIRRTISKIIQDDPKYDVFIAYYRMTAKDIAEHLWKGLNDFDVKSFIDIHDIPKTIETFTDEWRIYRDNSLKQSKIFILIMTRGFNKREEVIKEIKLAEDMNIQKLLFKRKYFKYDELEVLLGGKKVDLRNAPIHTFDEKEECLRKVCDILEGLGFLT